MENIDVISPENASGPPSPPPPPPPVKSNSGSKKSTVQKCDRFASKATRDAWDRMFDEAHGADVLIHTDDSGLIYAHSNVIGMASDVIRGMIKQDKRNSRRKSISILGVPHDAVRVFVRFLYSSCYEKQDMEDFAMHLLVLSHVYVVPQLKRVCESHFENTLLNKENVIDVFQLALLCDAPRLGLLCHRMILKSFEEVSNSQGWIAMKQSHPSLHKELLRSVSYELNSLKQRSRKQKEIQTYTQLYDAMEAFVHICRDGCREIGPTKIETPHVSCGFQACNGLEMLLKHLAVCKLRSIPGGCSRCKRMWQLLELHSRICVDSEQCKVPLCSSFKERMKKQNRKDEKRWKLLVKNVLSTKRIGGSPFFLQAIDVTM
ncbi:BTB/POZ and TAZ domain-containing protein 5 [Raphanus sativus]|uniref:BTB/POZ and TAZ domain-containing protein 5-like n=1 Tax=Raphanus sativus TaxID=3726 RepID=A0A9W3D7Q7_RAPSA|nr:BTB/POZ and TAZ domain-containing protein 5-like [Raphanus sativus]KAJ4914145.1 BTB/POZ and TAZ domain-containing protein 5 [Raphanus sativus]